MKIILKRKVLIQVFEIIAEMQFEETKPAYQKILSIGKTDKITADSILFFFSEYNENLQKILANNIIRFFKVEKFIDDSGNLTVIGNNIVELGKVPIKEKGKYLIWCLEDPLWGKCCIHFTRMDYDYNSHKVEYGFPFSNIENRSFIDFIRNNHFVISRFISKDEKFLLKYKAIIIQSLIYYGKLISILKIKS